MNVAVAGRRCGRRHAERHDVAGAGAVGGGKAGRDEGHRVLDEVVGGDHQCDRVGASARRQAGRDRHGGGRVAPHGFENDLGLQTDRLQLLGSDEAHLARGHDQRLGEGRVVEALGRDLEVRQVVQQGDELLGHAFARSRPQARARSATHDHGEDLARIGPAAIVGFGGGGISAGHVAVFSSLPSRLQRHTAAISHKMRA